MNDNALQQPVIQDHSAFLAGNHDFQADIQILADSDLVGTILETVMLATNMRFAAVARVTADRWVACHTVDEVNFGLAEGDEIEIQSTFCQSVRETSNKVLFNDTATDDVYGNHPIAAKFGIVSYASIPIYRSDGSFFGTLCAIDTEPRNIKHPRAVAMLEMFADIIGRSLETEEQLEAEKRLAEQERELARIQEEFVAVLGHDLRNPVAALDAGFRQLDREPLTEGARKILPFMRSSLHRMNDLIENIMMHAVRYATPGTPIEVRGLMRECGIEISVANQGEAVPDELQENLFHPFQRGVHANGEGLGLGLYIASSIAVAHSGRIDVTCEDGTTTFVFKMPALSIAA